MSKNLTPLTPLTISILAGLLLTACGNPASQYGANVYDSAAINNRQEVKFINILALEPAKVKVDNSKNQDTAAIAGAALGALLGSTESSGYALGGGLAGGVIAGHLTDREVLVDGVNIIYMEDEQLLNSVQVGHLCAFSAGSALVVISRQNETRIQPNAATPCAKGQEHIVGVVSKHHGQAGVFERKPAKKAHNDTMADYQREKELLRQKNDVEQLRTNPYSRY